MSAREKPEDFELDSGICWPEFNQMTEEERSAYYENHPCPYQSLDEYMVAMRRWILWEYPNESEENVDSIMNMPERKLWIKDGYKQKIPIDLVAVDVMYFCG